MADTKTPDVKTETEALKFETNRVHQTLQKAEAEKASDYDTGDQIALRQDILNPNLHYGLANEEETLLPVQQSGTAQTGVADTGSGPLATDNGSTLPSQNSIDATRASTSSGLSAPEEIVNASQDQPILSVNNATVTEPITNADLPVGEPVAIPTVQTTPNASPSVSGGTLPPVEETNTEPVNTLVEADDASETTSENVTLDGSVTASDLDGDTISYSLDGQPSEGSVSFNADGSYSFDPGTDFDDLAVGESRTVTFDFTADDGNGSTDTGTVTIEVTGTNDAPTAIDLSATSVDENDGGAVIGTLTTTDVDASDSHSYGVDDTRFTVVDDGTGTMLLKLKDGVSLDHESEPTVTVTVTTTDNNGASFSQDFTINVADLNEAVTADDASETTSENVTLDGSVTASDLDGDTISYSLDGQPSEGSVSFNADGSYSFDPGTDFDDLAVGESRTVTFDFTADDGNGSTDTGTVTIEVTGTNDAPTAIDLSATSVDENDGGAVIGTLTTTDVDASDSHSYGVDDTRFTVVDDGTGTMLLKLKDGVSLDHESEPTVTVTVTTTDNNGASHSQDFTINVADLNEAVTADDASETTSENVTLDGSVTASDLDGDTISYSLDGQPSEGSVSFNADGSYSFDPGTDFDDLAVGESRTVTFDFTADDGNGSTDTGTVTIEVTGTNDAPTAIDLSATSVDENDGGAVIGTLSTTDVDASDSHSYGVDDTRFTVVDDGTGTMLLKLKDGVSLDHESEPTVTVTVTTTDNNGASHSQDFTINVADLNEAVTADDASETTSENVTLDGSVTASDLDGDSISYSLDGQPSEGSVSFNADGSYSFDPGTDFDDLAVGESRTVTFDFTADDGNGSTDTGTVTIEVTGTNDAPTAIDLSATSVDENDGGAVIGTLTTTDVDASDSHSYGVDDTRFTVVDDGTGTMLLKLKDGVSLDHESEPTVTVTVTTTDNNGASHSQDFTINVADLNEAVTADDASETTSENVTLDGSVTASDLDGDTISYSLDGQPSEGSVSFNADGSYSFDPGTDFDDLAVGESRTVTFDFTADDGNGSTDTGTVTIEVTGTNDAPTAIDLSATSVDENDGGAVIGTLTTTDVDASDSHSYGVDDTRFTVVDDGTGTMLLKLKDGVSLDHESEPTVTVTVTTTDNNGASHSQDFTINVADLNEAVTADDASETTSENVTLDGSVTASDLDGDSISYSLDGQPSEGSVSFNADGSYSFDPGTDFDDLAVGESRTVTFDFTADDGNGSTDTGTVTIEVTGTNDAPTAIELSATSVDENDGGAVIGTLSTTDVDASDSHSYGVDDTRFTVVDDGTGTMLLKLKDGVSLDHESEPTVTVTVTTTDNNGASHSQDFTINVADLNEAVTADDASETTSENVTLDGSVTASDLDGDSISYSLDGQPSEGSVSFNADGSYSFDPGTDFDDLAVGESRTVTFDFTADDGNGSTDTGTVTIEVTGTNDAPTAIDLSATSVDENDGGAVIGTLSTTDVDASDSHSYGVDDTRFTVVDDGTGTMLLKLKDGVSLDHESEPTVTVTVTTTDNNGASHSQDFTINVADLNEAVTADDASETTSENVTLDGSVTASDLDGDTISYSLDGQPSEGSVSFNADGSYSFDPGTDFDDLAVGESRTVTFDFTADDGNGSTDTGTVTIEVTGTNDAPTAIDLSATSVDENDGGAVIGTLTTTDVDASDSHSYGVDDTRFTVVDDGTGTMLLKLKDGVSLDHESEPTVTVTVTTTDNNGASHSQDFTINVADLNEAVTADDASETTSENVTLDGSVTASDLDGDTISYSLDGQPSEGSVSFNADGSYSFDPGTDFDDLAVGESRTVTFDFTADDGNGSTDTGTVTIEVTGTNDAPTAIDLSATSVDENDGGAVIGTLSTTDVDASDSHSYGVDDTRFTVVDDGTGTMLLKLKDGVSLDHESEPTVTVTVTTTDNNGASHSQDFTINVADLNEGPTLTSNGSYNFFQNGSFESFSGGTYQTSDGSGWYEDASLNGWTESNVDIQESARAIGGATDGDYVLDLAYNDNGSVSQYIEGMQDGDDYTMSIDLQSRGGIGESIVEVVWNGSVIATIDPATDGSGWHTYTLTLTSGNGDGSDTLTLNEVGTNNALGTFVDNITITDSNGYGVWENEAGAKVATLSTIDPDADDTASYEVSDSRFEVVDDGSGNMVLKLKDGVSLNYESEQSVDVTVTVTDSGGMSDSQTLTVHVGDVNEAVTAYGGTVYSTENQVLTGNAFATDVDGDDISYSVVSQPSGGTITMSSDGVSSFDPGTDFDDLAVGETRTVSFQYQADDGNGSTSVATVNIVVTGTNDAPTAVFVSNDTVEENSAGAVIGTLTTSDVDASDTHIYTVSDDRFEVVDDGSGNMILKLKDGVSLDYEAETNGEISFTVTSDDGNGGTVTETLTVTVSDVNEAPTLSASGSYNFLYNGSFEIFNGGTHYGGDGTGWIEDAYIDGWTQSDIDIHESGHMSLGATDGDYHVDLAETSNGTLSREMEGLSDGDTYSLSIDLKSRGSTGDGVSGTAEEALGQSVVQVIWNGEVIATIDPAEDGLGWNTYTLDLTAGSGDGTNTITFVEVGSENSYGTLIDNVQITDNSGFGVLENEAGAEIAVLSVDDPDSGESYSYTVSDSRFEVVVQDGETVLKLVDGVSLDYETASHVSVNVTVTDSGGLSDTQTLDIQVGDIDDFASYHTVTGDNHDNMLHGTNGDDIISGQDGADTINAYAGDDIVYGGTGADTIDGGDGNDDIYGGSDNDTISGGEGNDFINGEDGADTIYGNAGSDSLHGEAGDDWIYGGDGADTIYGGENNDVLFGDAGNDTIYGGSGNDHLIGGTGDDYLNGGEGDDTFYYAMGYGNDVVDGGASGDWTDSLVVLASDGSDTTTYGTDWTITLTTGTVTMVDGSDQMLLSDDATGTIDFSDGGQIEFENIDRVSW